MTEPLSTLIDRIHIVENDLDGFFGKLGDAATRGPVRLGFVNAHAVNLAHRDPQFARDLNACEWLVRDGAGMKILYRLLGRPAGLNLNGTDLIPQILACYTGKTALLLGTQEPWLSTAAGFIEDQGLRVVGKVDGFQEDDFYVEMAEASRADLIILAMGMPKQERIAARLHRAFCPASPADLGARDDDAAHPCLIVCGGAILDFIGGKVTRAPRLWRKIGMEWLYRLLCEPRRLFGRYVIGNAVFLGRALCLAGKAKRRAR